MQTTSALYKSILSGEHWFESRVVLEGVGTFDIDSIVSLRIVKELFKSTPSVGNAISSEIFVELLEPEVAIPKACKIIPYVRVCNNTYNPLTKVYTAAQSEWLQQGVFFIDTREVLSDGYSTARLLLHGYDALLKADIDFPSQTHAFPTTPLQIVLDVAAAIGVALDTRTVDLLSGDSYAINLPSNYSCREVLQIVAGMFVGNFTMSYDGKLLLRAIYDLPPETNFLITRDGEAIVFGEDRILV